jgi:hypothetical protein
VAEGVHERDQEHLEDDGVPEPHHRGHDGVEARARLAGDEPPREELSGKRPDSRMDHHLGQDQERHRDQVAHVGFDVIEELDRNRPTDRASLDHRKDEQRQPRNERDGDHPPPEMVERVRHPGAEKELVERPPQYQ